MSDEFYRAAAKHRCNSSHLFFTRYFFKQRHGTKFRVNWHHYLIADEIEEVIEGRTKNLVICVPPGSSKTEEAVINFIARGLARNPRARFLHLSYSDDLALLNSQTARDMVQSEEFQALWPMKISADSKAKKRWNVDIEGKQAGGVYATSLNGQITGFRAGHMEPGWQGAIIIDDPLKPEDAFSKVKLEQANRKLLTTVKSRRANPDTPIVLIMQRISEGDPVGFIRQGGLPGAWKYVTIPAMIDDAYVNGLPEKYRDAVDSSVRDDKGRFSYWEYKEPIAELNEMETGKGKDQAGNAISRSVFNSQYQQNPVAVGGNIFRGEYFIRYKTHPKISYREIYGDTAQKTGERNDYSVFEVWGHGTDGKIYLLDLLRGKWESPELKRRAIAFWKKHSVADTDKFGQLRWLKVEDKSSGTGLIQEIRADGQIPVKGIERIKDKYTRSQDALPYIESGMVCIPEDAPFTNDFIAEFEAFTADDTHLFDDQIDPTMDAIAEMISTKNKVKMWERLSG